MAVMTEDGKQYVCHSFGVHGENIIDLNGTLAIAYRLKKDGMQSAETVITKQISEDMEQSEHGKQLANDVNIAIRRYLDYLFELECFNSRKVAENEI